MSLKWVAAAWFVALLPTAPAADTVGDCARSSEPAGCYDTPLLFEVRRDGVPVGEHHVTFTPDDTGRLRVEARLELTVRFLGVAVYRYTYASRALWCGDTLVSLTAEQNDDGERSKVIVAVHDGRLTVSGPKGQADGDVGLFPTNHWHPGVLTQNQVINTLNGSIESVTIRQESPEDVQAHGRVIAATPYQYRGPIETRVWYDPRGRWVKMRFTAKDGSTIDYRCLSCGVAVTPDNGL